MWRMSGSATRPLPSAGPTSIRNVVLVGPSGSGKSRLFDHVVDAVVPGRAPSDRADDGLRARVARDHGVVLTLLDAPGNPDFVGEVRAGLRAADAALFVVSAADGADAAARAVPTAAHSCHRARVAASTPSEADTTNSAASAARRPARSSPTKSG